MSDTLDEDGTCKCCGLIPLPGTTNDGHKAMKVMCPFCKAPVDSPCVNEGRVLRAFPAHEVRSRAARQVLDSINTRRKT